jgi:hypothetical protein
MLATALAGSLLGLAGGPLVGTFWNGLAVMVAAGSVIGAPLARIFGIAVTLAALMASLALYYAEFGAAAFSEAGLPVSAAFLAICVSAIGVLVRESRYGKDSAQEASKIVPVPAE